MNKLRGHIKEIQSQGTLSIVSVEIHKDIIIKAIVIETPETADYLRLDNSVIMMFKETEVIIGKDVNHNISLQNQIPGKIKEIVQGELLSKVIIETPELVTSVISTNAVNTLGLNNGMDVVAMIKLNEVMISTQ